MLHTLTMLLDNQPGALSRVVGLFSQRGYNIHSLNVAPIRDGSLSRLTLVVDEPDNKIDAIVKHVDRVIDVVNVSDITGSGFVGAEMLLVKFATPNSNIRTQIEKAIGSHKATIVDSTETKITVQLGGAPEYLDSILSSFSDFEITEVARSGLSAMSKGADFLEEVDYRTPH